MSNRSRYRKTPQEDVACNPCIKAKLRDLDGLEKEAEERISYDNKNIDSDRSKLNLRIHGLNKDGEPEIRHDKYKKSLKERILMRIQEVGAVIRNDNASKKDPTRGFVPKGKNTKESVVAEGIELQLSHYLAMKLLKDDGLLDAAERIRKDAELKPEHLTYQYFADAYKFICTKFGKDNVVGAYIHLDEYTPHMHVFVVPITMRVRKYRGETVYKKDGTEKVIGSLNAKGMFGPKSLKKLWTEHAKEMEKYGATAAKGLVPKGEYDSVASIEGMKRTSLRSEFEELLKYGLKTIGKFDQVCDNGGAVLPTQQEQDQRDFLEKECKRDYSKYTTKALVKKVDEVNNYINLTQDAIIRMGKRLQEIASNIPTISLFPGRKNKLLAHEAEMQASVAAAKAEAKRHVQDAEKAEAKARNAEERAKDREAQAADEKNKYQRLNSQLQTKIQEAAAKASDEAYGYGYLEGVQEGQTQIQKLKDEIQTLKTEIEKLQKESQYNKKRLEYFRKTNPFLENAEVHLKELRDSKDFNLNSEEVLHLFQGQAVEKTYKIIRNGKKYEFPVEIDIKEDTKGKMRIWYNGTTLENCKEDLQQQADKLDKGKRQVKGVGGPS